MPYYTGTVATSSELHSAILSAAAINGWTVNGDDVGKGFAGARLTVSGTTELRIWGATDASGSNLSHYYKRIAYSAGAWPATYDLFIHENPNIIICVVRFGTGYMQTLMFGELIKSHADAYSGGNFFWASLYAATNRIYANRVPSTEINWTIYNNSYISIHPIVTVNSTNLTLVSNIFPDWVYHNIDNLGWNTSTSIRCFTSNESASMLYNSPNTWNNQTILIPWDLVVSRSTYHSYLGTIPHIRLLRIDNYNIGDIIDLSPDKWKVFSWKYKSVNPRNGTSTTTGSTNWESSAMHTGTFGFAVRYDGP